MEYRREIDGLRAIAVIVVIFFHAGFPAFSGGYVGVDIFFVISGYLITSIIASEMEQSHFSMINFYERRARRILPALFVVMLFSLILVAIIFLPTDVVKFSKSLIAVSTYCSNIFFWKESGYWGAVNELKPLLHTWSLAVEEQYYIFFPLFLLFVWRFGKKIVVFVLLLGVTISLFLAQWGALHKPSAAFFLLPTRAWELGVGAIVAFLFLYQPQIVNQLRKQKILTVFAQFAGVFLLVYSIVIFTPDTPFPGFFALAPVLGTAILILFVHPGTLCGKILGQRVFVAIGLISYSAYLWHQPLLAIARHLFSPPLPFAFLLLLCFLSFVLAWLSWRFIETPFRKKGVVSRKGVASFVLFGTLFFIAVGIGGIVSNGADWRSPESLDYHHLTEITRQSTGLNSRCDGVFTLSPLCRTSDRPEILLWGDSFAMHLLPAIQADNPHARIIQMTKSACGPFFDMAFVSKKFPAERCLEFTGQVYSWLRHAPTVKYVVLSSPFEEYFRKGAMLQNRNNEQFPASEKIVADMLLQTLKKIVDLGKIPIVVSPTPGNGKDIGRCVLRAVYFGRDPSTCDYPLSTISPERKKAFALMDDIGRQYNVIRLDKMLCVNGVCKSSLLPSFLYRDGGHMCREGAMKLGQEYRLYNLVKQSTPHVQ